MMTSNVPRIAMITGAASGLGAATASHLISHGFAVVLIDKNLSALQNFACDLEKKFSGRVKFFAADILDEKILREGLQEATQYFQKAPDICINCAGIAPAARIIGKHGVMSLENFQEVINVNLLGAFNIMRLFTDNLLNPANTQNGVMIHTASIAAFEGQIGQVAYSASKAGIIGMILPAARELAQFNIRVMAIAPGVMDTPMMAAMPEKIHADLAENPLFPKRFGDPEEFARLVLHIIENQYLNASVIRLDGGLRLD